MAAIVQRFPFPEPTPVSLAPTRISPSTSTSRRQSSLPASRRGRQPERRSRLAYVSPDEPPCSACVEDADPVTRATPASLPGKPGDPGFPASIGSMQAWSRRRPEYGSAICSLPMCRQLEQAIGRVSWKHRIFQAKCPPPPSLASGGVTRMRGDPQGHREPAAGRRVAPGPKGDAQTQPCCELFRFGIY